MRPGIESSVTLFPKFPDRPGIENPVQISYASHQRAAAATRALTEEQKKLIEFWRTELQDFRNRSATSATGGVFEDDVKAGLKANEERAKKVIADYHDLLKIEEQAGDAAIKNKRLLGRCARRI